MLRIRSQGIPSFTGRSKCIGPVLPKTGCKKIHEKLASGFWHIQARPESGTERLAVASGFVRIRYAIVDSRLGDDVGGVGPILLVVLSVLYVGATLSERLARAVHTAAERERTIPPSLAAGVVRVAVLATAAVIALGAAGVTAYLPVIVLSICLAEVLALVVAGLIIGGRGFLRAYWRPATWKSSILKDQW